MRDPISIAALTPSGVSTSPSESVCRLSSTYFAITPPSSRLLLGHLHEPAERIYELHLLHRPTFRIKKPRAGDDVGQAARPRDRHVQAVPREEEVEPARDVLAARARHREEGDGRLLALELVHGSDPHLVGERLAETAHV